MKFETKYKILLWKRYFEQGYNNTQFVKYFFLLGGFLEITSRDSMLGASVLGIIYIIFCFAWGYWWFASKLITVEAEIGNRYNLLSKELRRYMNGKNKRPKRSRR